MRAPAIPKLPFAVLAMLAVGAFASPARAQHRVDKEGTGAIVRGAEGLPDLARGKAAAAAGRTEDAERDLAPLAERGYVEAELALGRLYAHQDAPGANEKAIRWLRAALPDSPPADVPLARALVREGGTKALTEAEQLFARGWDEREDAEALSGLIELYAAFPEYDRQKRARTLVATAEKLDQPQPTAAVIRWYRATQDTKDHAERLLAQCRKSLDLVPECYVDLVRDARAKGDKDAMSKLTLAAMSQFGQDRVPFNVAAGIARALVATPNNDEPEAAPVAVSDVPEIDASELAPTAAHVGGVSGAASTLRSCAQDPIGVASSTAMAPVAIPAAAPAATPAPAAATSAAAPTPGATKAPVAAAAPAAANAEPDLANQIIAKLAAGSPEARVEAAGVVVRYPYLAPDFDVVPALEEGRKQHVADATLFLGQLHLYGQRGMRDPKTALRYLEEASNVPETAVEAHYFLGRLYQYGYLDEVDPAKAEAELLLAARQNYIPADGALARLYASAKGICANRANAYVFAELGARGGTEAMRTLRDQLRAALSPQDRASAEQMLKQEQAARAPSDRTSGLAQADTGGQNHEK